MSSPHHMPAARMVAYSRPEIQDYGSLAELTADFDLTVAGSVLKVVTMAAVSAPLTGGGGGGAAPAPPDGAGVLAGGGDGLSGGPDVPTDGGGVLPDRADGDTLGDRAVGGEGTGGGAPGGSDGGTSSGADGGGAGGRLPFTGYAAMAVAALGAAFTTAGVAARATLRRRPR